MSRRSRPCSSPVNPELPFLPGQAVCGGIGRDNRPWPVYRTSVPTVFPCGARQCPRCGASDILWAGGSPPCGPDSWNAPSKAPQIFQRSRPDSTPPWRRRGRRRSGTCLDRALGALARYAPDVACPRGPQLGEAVSVQRQQTRHRPPNDERRLGGRETLCEVPGRVVGDATPRG
jgi:hypothetical protein